MTPTHSVYDQDVSRVASHFTNAARPDPFQETVIHDDGTTVDMSMSKPDNLKPLSRPMRIKGVGPKLTEATHYGTRTYMSTVDGVSHTIHRSFVLWVPSLRFSLFAQAPCDKEGLVTLTFDKMLRIHPRQDSNQDLARYQVPDLAPPIILGHLKQGLYHWDLSINHKTGQVAHVASVAPAPVVIEALRKKANVDPDDPAQLALWHDKLMHLGMDMTKRIFGFSQKLNACTGCAFGKAHRQSLPKQSTTIVSDVGDLTLIDLGFINIATIGGARILAVFADGASRRGKVYLLRSKDAVVIALADYNRYIRNYFHRNLKVVRVDGGGEFQGDFKDFCDTHGISLQLTEPYRSSQNGIAERYIRTLKEAARSALFASNAPKFLWGYAIQYACWIRNHLPHRALKGDTPHSRFFKCSPEKSAEFLSFAHPFACEAFAFDPTADKGLQSKSIRCAFLGFDWQRKGFLLYRLDTCKVLHCRDVVVKDHIYPFHGGKFENPTVDSILDH